MRGSLYWNSNSFIEKPKKRAQSTALRDSQLSGRLWLTPLTPFTWALSGSAVGWGTSVAVGDGVTVAVGVSVGVKVGVGVDVTVGVGVYVLGWNGVGELANRLAASFGLAAVSLTGSFLQVAEAVGETQPAWTPE